MQWVECVPNFSEGKRPEIIQEIISSITGVTLLGYESDPDHNRTVVTFVGQPEAVLEAAYNAIATAARLIDMEHHQGQHPRLGATDVVPFIPIEGVTMQDCVDLARRLGQRVGAELDIPVYLYEAAATRPDRQNLADIRRGEYESLKQDILTNPDRQPDFGPARLGKAGAVVIGARAPLIAYNVYLTTDNIEIAKEIARSIRHSSGGLRFVKAIGLLVKGKAQVSMNLTNHTHTPIHRVVEMIRREAARYGVSVESSELVGLIPQQALFDSAQWYLQLDNFQSERVLEIQLKQKLHHNDSFLNELASDNPTPGGGSAAAYSGAMAASLITMVARLTSNKHQDQAVVNRMSEVVQIATQLRAALQANVQRDATAFKAVIEAFQMPKSTEAELSARQKAIEDRMMIAGEVPLETASYANTILALAAEVAEIGHVNAITDAACAGSLALTSIYAAGLNVRINAKRVDPFLANRWEQTLIEIERQAEGYMARINTALAEKGGL